MTELRPEKIGIQGTMSMDLPGFEMALEFAKVVPAFGRLV